MKDLIEEFVIEFGSDRDCDRECDSDDEEEPIDNDNRQLIDDTLCSTTSTESSTICTNPRRDLTNTIQNLTRTFVIDFFHFRHCSVCVHLQKKKSLDLYL